MINYTKLMSFNPTSYHSFTNSKGQIIDFLEHPLNGDETFIICACHSLKLADYSGFFELDDMLASHKEYEPSFMDGKLYIGDFLAN